MSFAVIPTALPSSLEGYYQEAGLATRRRTGAGCCILWRSPYSRVLSPPRLSRIKEGPGADAQPGAECRLATKIVLRDWLGIEPDLF
ncbi:MAG: hypothetical protein R3F37_09760 [Candidatus Competibacteraceae bacterium]